MHPYVIYQCNTCRRTKDVERDNTRAFLTRCIITKGCNGRLFKIGTRAFLTSVQPVPELVDWYPRNQKIETFKIEEDKFINLSTSYSGNITVAVQQSEIEANARDTLIVKFIQQKIKDVSYQQYQYRILEEATLISGKDLQGKTLRLSTNTIADNRIFVKVNGVARFYPDDLELSVNSITFKNEVLYPGTMIDIYVYDEAATIEKELKINLNKELLGTVGAWSNVNKIQTWNNDGSLSSDYWWVYTGSVDDTLTLSQLKLSAVTTILGESINLEKVAFLLADEPYENVDRRSNFMVSFSTLGDSFTLQAVKDNSIIKLLVNAIELIELYPPFVVVLPLLQPDTYSTTNSIQTDSTKTVITSSKILGPV